MNYNCTSYGLGHVENYLNPFLFNFDNISLVQDQKEEKILGHEFQFPISEFVEMSNKQGMEFKAEL